MNTSRPRPVHSLLSVMALASIAGSRMGGPVRPDFPANPLPIPLPDFSDRVGPARLDSLREKMEAISPAQPDRKPLRTPEEIERRKKRKAQRKSRKGRK
jgi:hypothetical protein